LVGQCHHDPQPWIRDGLVNAGRKALEPAYVIHRRAYSDTSLIVELLTPSNGRVSVLARGVKQGKSQKALLLEPFKSLHVSWTGRGDLPVLSAIEEAGNPIRLQGEALACGYYINELIYRLVPKFEPAADIFAHYWPTISACVDEDRRAIDLRYFEVALLEQLGLAPRLDHDIITGEDTVADKTYYYRIPDGPVAAEIANGNGVEISGTSLLNIAAMEFDSPTTQRESKRLTRELLHYHLDGKPLMSRALFKSFKQINSESGDA